MAAVARDALLWDAILDARDVVRMLKTSSYSGNDVVSMGRTFTTSFPSECNMG